MSDAADLSIPHSHAGQGSHGSSCPLSAPQVGMIAFLLTEVAFFSTLLVAYVFYLGKSLSGPTPREVLSLPLAILGSVFLFSSSATIHQADKALRRGEADAFRLWLGLTIFLGLAFLAGTGVEWRELIYKKNLTISTNLFGTTYFTLVGFHAFHVSIGVLMMVILLNLTLRVSDASSRLHVPAELISWYWHFVDAVWVVVFLVVYVFGR